MELTGAVPLAASKRGCSHGPMGRLVASQPSNEQERPIGPWLQSL